MHRISIIIVLSAIFALACGNDTSGKGKSNNGDFLNNGETNNGSNNGATNNGATNNGANNGATNNGANNGATNNGATNNGATNNGATNNGTDPGLQKLEDELWSSICEAVFQCPNRTTVQFVVFIGGRFASEAECKASAYRGDVDVMQSQLGIDAGRVAVDESKIEACADAFREFYCDPRADSTPIQTACDGLWTGTVAEGEACVLHEECVEGNYCPSDEACGDAVCTAVPQPDATCGDEMCDLGTEYCGQNGCEARKAAGDACDADEECAEGSGCLQRQGGRVCTEYFTQAEGGLCQTGTPYCETGLVCVGQNVQRCAALTFGDEGDTCNFQGAACKPGLACQDLGLGGGTCEPARGDGEDCQASFQCSIELYCDGFDISMPAQFGTCLARKADGETCDANDQCASEFCDQPGDTMGSCAAKSYCEL